MLQIYSNILPGNYLFFSFSINKSLDSFRMICYRSVWSINLSVCTRVLKKIFVRSWRLIVDYFQQILLKTNEKAAFTRSSSRPLFRYVIPFSESVEWSLSRDNGWFHFFIKFRVLLHSRSWPRNILFARNQWKCIGQHIDTSEITISLIYQSNHCFRQWNK